MPFRHSHLGDALDRMAQRSASAVVARSRTSSLALNSALLRRLASAPGHQDALLASPVFEAAKAWKPAEVSLGDLAGDLLDERLVEALASAQSYVMPRERAPYAHQLAAWRASLEDNKSVLVTSGTGSGKTECFLIPLLNDILTRSRIGGGIQAILLYPLNALIESQRERLSAWASGLGGRVKFALYNGDTPETAFQGGARSTEVELTNRKDIRKSPPDILVTNITMLEYMLLREQDRALLDASSGALRWIVLDEAHSYVGSQAAEMALLLRRVRAAFNVSPQDVRLIATSATIGGEANANEKLAEFTAALAGQETTQVAVVEGVEDQPILPLPGPDVAVDVASLEHKTDAELWQSLAPHPRLQALRRQLNDNPVDLAAASTALFDDPDHQEEAQKVLDAAGQAASGDNAFLPWRAHLFHRAQGGIYACIDAACAQRDPELASEGSDWQFGAIYLAPRPICKCGAPVFEVVACTSCGTVHLQALMHIGAQPRLETPEAQEGDDYALDAEPEDTGEDEDAPLGTTMVFLRQDTTTGNTVWVESDTGLVFENGPPATSRCHQVQLIEEPKERNCCDEADHVRMQSLRFGPTFFLGNAIPQALDDLTLPENRPGLPAGGRKAISFSDSRQGVARLAAKLQQEAERTLTRSFLYHAVQKTSAPADPAKLSEIEAKIARLRAADEAGFADMIADFERERASLSGEIAKPIPWTDLIDRFAANTDLTAFAGEVWSTRKLGGRMADHPGDLAQMFLFRELFRRPKVQNNPETMGLVRLAFPSLEAEIASGTVPRPLAQAGVDAEGWRGLAFAAIDFVFRDNLATNLPEWMVPIVSPKFGKLNSIVPANAPAEETSKIARAWPGPIVKTRPSRLQKMVYGLFGGDPGNPQHQDLAAETLEALWATLQRNVLVSMGTGHWRLDFNKAAVAKLEQAWLCPVTRRPFSYSVAGRTPYDITRPMDRIPYPSLPHADAGGLTTADRKKIADWCQTDPAVAALRRRGLWSDMTDRVATYPAFIRAQEHSAQIERKVLKNYETRFNDGEINLLNCSTTMEMGVDIAAVQLVVNANVPPALSNYRQRVGRAGRRREPWAFGLTFCRDLPLDILAFKKPIEFLKRPIAAPKVWFDSAPLVQRHVNAALLGHWFRTGGGLNIRANSGWFFGTEKVDTAIVGGSPVDSCLDDLKGDLANDTNLVMRLTDLVKGTVLDGVQTHHMIERTLNALEQITQTWRQEYRDILDRQNGAEDDAAKAFELRAKRMAGEFLIGDLARRGFTPAYGFATDVVTFDPLISGGQYEDQGISFHKRGGASRELHQAIREYAPGAELVIDGLVYQSEGVRPAWGAETDTSKLEDFQYYWECKTCHAFGVSAVGAPDACPSCQGIAIETKKILRPAGFLTRKPPHTGYEALEHSPYIAPRVSARGADWIALPDPTAGRYRHDPVGLVVNRSSGKLGGGFAVCLDCGRAAPMADPEQGVAAAIPSVMERHFPLARSQSTRLTSDNRCPGGYTAPNRLQRNVHLAQTTRTDVFEFQLPAGVGEGAALALGAALREALSERLGVETAEIGVAAGPSVGVDQDRLVSLWLLDRAAGGAGLVARLQEAELFAAMLARAAEVLDCPEKCVHGCPSCILQPDLSLQEIRLDRAAALRCARTILERIRIPDALQVFGPATRSLGGSLTAALDRARRAGTLSRVDLFLRGHPDTWDLSAWNARGAIRDLAESGTEVRLLFAKNTISHAGFDLGVKLALHRISEHAKVGIIPEMLDAGGLAMVACLSGKDGARRGVAVQAENEAVPTVEWANGSGAAILVGPYSSEATPTLLSASKLLEFGTGNGKVIEPDASLDGPIRGFGARFWKALSRHLPLEMSAMADHGVEAISYSDRYMLTPVTVVLLSETLRAAPGATGASLSIDLAPNEAPWNQPDFPKVFHSFIDDGARISFLRALLPSANIRMAMRKNDLPHRRQMTIRLKDGRRYRVLFDQGFGGWKCGGKDLRHDFRQDPALQAKGIFGRALAISGGDEPIVWESQ
ncbi:MAG: DEAD/DEAH box helicase [Maritimibacter sp.]|nr:DEAD/DEAH box helicase [Maritimibacter sp.]